MPASARIRRVQSADQRLVDLVQDGFQLTSASISPAKRITSAPSPKHTPKAAAPLLKVEKTTKKTTSSSTAAAAGGTSTNTSTKESKPTTKTVAKQQRPPPPQESIATTTRRGGANTSEWSSSRFNRSDVTKDDEYLHVDWSGFLPRLLGHHFESNPEILLSPFVNGFKGSVLHVELDVPDVAQDPLVAHLRDAFAVMVDIVLREGGDILQLTQSEMLCLWRINDTSEDAALITARAVQCGLQLCLAVQQLQFGISSQMMYPNMNNNNNNSNSSILIGSSSNLHSILGLNGGSNLNPSMNDVNPSSASPNSSGSGVRGREGGAEGGANGLNWGGGKFPSMTNLQNGGGGGGTGGAGGEWSKLKARCRIGTGNVLELHGGGTDGRWVWFVAGPALEQISTCAAPDSGRVYCSRDAMEKLNSREFGVIFSSSSTSSAAVLSMESRLTAPMVISKVHKDMNAAAILVVCVPTVKCLVTKERVRTPHPPPVGPDGEPIEIDHDELDKQLVRNFAEAVQQTLVDIQQTIMSFGGTLVHVCMDGGRSGFRISAAFCSSNDMALSDMGYRAVSAAVQLRESRQCVCAISTGRVACGSLGTKKRRECVVLGKAVDLAHQLLQVARTGGSSFYRNTNNNNNNSNFNNSNSNNYNVSSSNSCISDDGGGPSSSRASMSGLRSSNVSDTSGSLPPHHSPPSSEGAGGGAITSSSSVSSARGGAGVGIGTSPGQGSLHHPNNNNINDNSNEPGTHRTRHRDSYDAGSTCGPISSSIYSSSNGGGTRAPSGTVSISLSIDSEPENYPPLILCDELTHAKTQSLFHFEPFPSVGCFPAPLPGSMARAWVPIREKDSASRPLDDDEALPSPQTALDRCGVVGRTSELSQLVQAIRNYAKDGVGSVILIDGVAGMGKSRLLESARELMRGWMRNLHARSTATARTSYFSPWGSILSQLYQETDRERLRIQLEMTLRNTPNLHNLAPVVSALLPPVDRRSTPSGGLATADNVRFVLSYLLQQKLEGDQPTCLTIDDAHTMNPHSWRMLRSVLQSQSKMIVIVTIRPSRTIKHEIRPLMGLPRVIHMQLKPLGLADTSQMITNFFLGNQASDRVTKAVLDASFGIPLFVGELLQSAQSSGLVYCDNAKYVRERDEGADSFESEFAALAGKTTAIEQVTATRLEVLSSLELAVLKSASVFDGGVTERILVAMLQTSREMVQDALESLLEAGLLVCPDPTDPSALYHFPHQVLRKTVYKRMFPSHTKQQHLAAAQFLEAEQNENSELNDDEDATTKVKRLRELGRHWRAGGYDDRAVTFFDEAAQTALHSNLNADAVTLFAEVLRSRESSYQDESREGDCERRMAIAYTRMGMLDEAKEKLESALQRTLGFDRKESIALGVVLESTVQIIRRLVQMLGLGISEGSSSSMDEYDVLLLQFKCHRLLFAIACAKSDRIRALFDCLRALNIGETLGTSGEVATMYAALGVVLYSESGHHPLLSYLGRTVGGMFARLALRMIPLISDRGQKSEAYWLSALLKIADGHPYDASELFERALAGFDWSPGFQPGFQPIPNILGGCCVSLLLCGRLHQAQQVFKRIAPRVSDEIARGQYRGEQKFLNLIILITETLVWNLPNREYKIDSLRSALVSLNDSNRSEALLARIVTAFVMFKANMVSSSLEMSLSALDSLDHADGPISYDLIMCALCLLQLFISFWTIMASGQNVTEISSSRGAITAKELEEMSMRLLKLLVGIDWIETIKPRILLLKGRCQLLQGNREDALDTFIGGAVMAKECRMYGERMLLLHQLANLVESEAMEVEPSTVHLWKLEIAQLTNEVPDPFFLDTCLVLNARFNDGKGGASSVIASPLSTSARIAFATAVLLCVFVFAAILVSACANDMWLPLCQDWSAHHWPGSPHQ